MENAVTVSGGHEAIASYDSFSTAIGDVLNGICGSSGATDSSSDAGLVPASKSLPVSGNVLASSVVTSLSCSDTGLWYGALIVTIGVSEAVEAARSGSGDDSWEPLASRSVLSFDAHSISVEVLVAADSSDSVSWDSSLGISITISD